MNEAVDEGDFPHAPEAEKSTLIKQAEMWLRIDGVIHKGSELFNKWKAHMEHWNDRGPDPDNPQGNLDEIIDRAVRAGARRATIDIGNYTEGGNKGSSPSWRNWVLTMLGSLIVIGVVSLVMMYANQKAMSERLDNFEHRIDNLERKIWRGGTE